MKSLKEFILEHRTKDTINIKCEQSGELIDPEITIYDKSSLDNFIQKYKNDKDNWQDKKLYIIEQKGNDWIAKTKTSLKIDIYRMTDSFLSSNDMKYSYDDIVDILENGEKMLIVL